MGLTRQEAKKLGLEDQYPKRGTRKVQGVMNHGEKKYAEILECRRLKGEILKWEYEPEWLVLGVNCTYLPDFRVTELDDSISFYEIKGPRVWAGTEKGYVKLKWAAQRYPQYRFFLARRRKGGVWDVQRVEP